MLIKNVSAHLSGSSSINANMELIQAAIEQDQTLPQDKKSKVLKFLTRLSWKTLRALIHKEMTADSEEDESPERGIIQYVIKVIEDLGIDLNDLW